MHFCQASSARARPCVGRHLRPYGILAGVLATALLRRAACARRRCGLRGAETGETGRECSKCFKPRGATKQNRRVVSRHSAPPHTGPPPPVTPHVTPHPGRTSPGAVRRAGADTRWRRDARHDRASPVSDTSHDTTVHRNRNRNRTRLDVTSSRTTKPVEGTRADTQHDSWKRRARARVGPL